MIANYLILSTKSSDDVYIINGIKFILPSSVQTEDDFTDWNTSVRSYLVSHSFGGKDINPYSIVDNRLGLCNDMFHKIFEFIDPVKNGLTMSSFLLVSKQLRTNLFAHCSVIVIRHIDNIILRKREFMNKQNKPQKIKSSNHSFQKLLRDNNKKNKDDDDDWDISIDKTKTGKYKLF